MKDFIDRIKKDFEFVSHYDRESLFFKVFLWIAYITVGVAKIIYCVVVLISIPLWIIPYMVYWCHKRKKRG